MLIRVLEAEVMDTEADAADYDAMDFSAVNAAFAIDFLSQFPDTPSNVLDIGTGTARIPIEIARRASQMHITAVDLSASMLKVAARNVQSANLADRIELKLVDAKRTSFEDCAFDAVISNSIVHHIPEPATFLREAVRLVKPGGLLFIRDLFRPADRATLDRLVNTYAVNDSPHQRQLFADSLHAALTVTEVQSIVTSFGFDPSTVSATSDRHWTWVAHSKSIPIRRE